MTSGNLRRLHILYWRDSQSDKENARTTELYEKLTYEQPEFDLHLKFRTELDFRFMNCNRNTEDYVRNRDQVEYLRPKKIRKEPLIYLELWTPNNEGSREEFISIDSDYRLRIALKHIYEVLEKEI